MNNLILLDTIKDFYKEFNKDSIASLDKLYAENIQFSDPFHRIEGIENLKMYFHNMACHVNYCRFSFENEAHNDDTIFLQWRMEYSHPKIKNGSALVIHGVSHLVINEKIVYHRDYFDSSEMLYKHIPLLGSVIRFIEKNMGA